ncbi:MAG: hypothetical protein SFW66_03950 [Gammaproteobacteria bacterium]|nr:hypothetical protein [Gammaproteobacteria bacterium]
MKIHYFSRPLAVDTTGIISQLDSRIRHSGILLEDPNQGMLSMEVMADGNLFLAQPTSIIFTPMGKDVEHIPVQANRWIYEVGETHLSLNEIQQHAAYWIEQHPTFTVYQDNCRKFVNDILQKWVSEKELQLSPEIDKAAFIHGPIKTIDSHISSATGQKGVAELDDFNNTLRFNRYPDRPEINQKETTRLNMSHPRSFDIEQKDESIHHHEEASPRDFYKPAGTAAEVAIEGVEHHLPKSMGLFGKTLGPAGKVVEIGATYFSTDPHHSFQDRVAETGIHVGLETSAVGVAARFGAGSLASGVIFVSEVAEAVDKQCGRDIEKGIAHHRAKESKEELSIQDKMLLSNYGVNPQSFESQEKLALYDARAFLKTAALPAKFFHQATEQIHARWSSGVMDMQQDLQRIRQMRAAQKSYRFNELMGPLIPPTTKIEIPVENAMRIKYVNTAQPITPEAAEVLQKFIPEDNQFGWAAGKSTREICKTLGCTKREAKLYQTLGATQKDKNVSTPNPEKLKSQMKSFQENFLADSKSDQGITAQFYSRQANKMKAGEIEEKSIEPQPSFSQQLASFNQNVSVVASIGANVAELCGDSATAQSIARFSNCVDHFQKGTAALESGNTLAGTGHLMQGMGNFVGLFDAKAGQAINVAGSAVMAVTSFASGNIIQGVMSTLNVIAGFRKKKKKANDALIKYQMNMIQGFNHVSQQNIALYRQAEDYHNEVMYGFYTMARFLDTVHNKMVQLHFSLKDRIERTERAITSQIAVSERNILERMQKVYEDLGGQLKLIEEQIKSLNQESKSYSFMVASQVALAHLDMDLLFSEVLDKQERQLEYQERILADRENTAREKIDIASDKMQLATQKAIKETLSGPRVLLDTRTTEKLSADAIQLELGKTRDVARGSADDFLTAGNVRFDSPISILRYVGLDEHWNEISPLHAINLLRNYANKHYLDESSQFLVPFVNADVLGTSSRALMRHWLQDKKISADNLHELNDYKTAIDRLTEFSAKLSDPIVIQKMFTDAEKHTKVFWEKANQYLVYHQTKLIKQNREKQFVAFKKYELEYLSVVQTNTAYPEAIKKALEEAAKLSADAQTAFQWDILQGKLTSNLQKPAEYFARNDSNSELKKLMLPDPASKFTQLQDLLTLEALQVGHLEFNYKYVEGTGRVELWPEFHFNDKRKHTLMLPKCEFYVSGGHASTFYERIFAAYLSAAICEDPISEADQAIIQQTLNETQMALQYNYNRELRQAMYDVLKPEAQAMDAAAAMVHLSCQFAFDGANLDNTNPLHGVLEQLETSGRIQERLTHYIMPACQQTNYSECADAVIEAIGQSKLYSGNAYLYDTLLEMDSLALSQCQSSAEIFSYIENRLAASPRSAHFPLLMAAGHYAFTNGEHALATRYYQDALTLQPDNGFIFERLTVCFYLQKQYTQAIEISNQWLAKISNAKSRVEQIECADDYSTAALYEDCSDASEIRARTLRGYALLSANQADEALIDFEFALDNMPQSFELRYLSARTLELSTKPQHLEQALAQYQDLSMEFKENIDCLQAQSRCLYQLKQPVAALDVLLTIDQLVPTNTENGFYCAKLMYELAGIDKRTLSDEDKKRMGQWILNYVNDKQAPLNIAHLKSARIILNDLCNISEFSLGLHGIRAAVTKKLQDNPEALQQDNKAYLRTRLFGEKDILLPTSQSARLTRK